MSPPRLSRRPDTCLRPLRSALSWCSLGAVLLLAGKPVWAAGEAAHLAAKPMPISAKEARAALGANLGGAPAATAEALPPGKDPLDHLRERLAEKLGGEAKPRTSKTGPITVKVVNKLDADDAGHGASARPASAKTGGHAPSVKVAGIDPAGAHGGHTAPVARLAALHRETSPAALAAPGEGTAAGGHASGDVHWSYQGEGGPGAWAQLKSEFATCASGKRQSPIDIRDGMRLQLEPVQFNYQPSALRVIDNGHTVQVNVGEGNSIEVMGRRFELLQFHFHRPSEERIDGKQFDMVAHLVHKNAEGRLAVVAVLLNRGAAQPLIQTVWNNLPLEKGEEQAVRQSIDLNALLPAERQYFTYMGSLTTPPCTEGVLWMVMKTPVQVSTEQINIFSRLYPMNARPLQSAGGRMIKESN
jgi:carbonic anhydrase